MSSNLGNIDKDVLRYLMTWKNTHAIKKVDLKIVYKQLNISILKIYAYKNKTNQHLFKSYSVMIALSAFLF